MLFVIWKHNVGLGLNQAVVLAGIVEAMQHILDNVQPSNALVVSRIGWHSASPLQQPRIFSIGFGEFRRLTLVNQPRPPWGDELSSSLDECQPGREPRAYDDA